MANLYQVGDMNIIQQQYSDTCAIKSQQLILNDYGIDVTEDQLVQYSIDQGLYTGNGTQMGDVGQLLADAGIPVVQVDNANVYTLVNELAQGHKVIVGVDADELWSGGIMTKMKDFFIGETPNHALIVSGIDTTDPNNIQVLLTDPGTGDLCKSYPLDQFMDAWQDSNCFMVSTQTPAPLAYNPEMINFDYSTGHLANIGDMSYDQFMTEHAMQIPDFPELDLMSYMDSDNTFGTTLFDSYAPFADPMLAMDAPLFDYNSTDPFATHPLHDVDTEIEMDSADVQEGIDDFDFLS